MFCSVCLCSFILQFYVLDFLLNCSFLFTDKLLCLVVHEIDYGDPEEYEAMEARVEVAEARFEVAKVEVAEAKVDVAEAKVEVAEAKVEVAEAKVEVAEAKVKVMEAKVEARFREMMLQQWLLSDEVEEGRRVAAAMVM